MELTTHEYDEITEIQHNLDAFKLDLAIDKLSDEQLVVLREQCQESVERQQGIIARVQDRLAQKDRLVQKDRLAPNN